jgi:hypothetical protein
MRRDIRASLESAQDIDAIKAVFLGAAERAIPELADPETLIASLLPDLEQWAFDLKRAFWTPEEIVALATRKLAAAVADLLEDGDLAAWMDRVQRIIATQLVMAGILGTVYHDVVQGLISMPDDMYDHIKYEVFNAGLWQRDMINARNRFEREQRFLRQFAWDIGAGRLSAKQIAWRMTLYSASAKVAYLEALYGDWNIPDKLYPGSHECRYACQCEIVIADNGDGTGLLTYVLGPNKLHCQGCVNQAGVHLIYRKRR